MHCFALFFLIILPTISFGQEKNPIQPCPKNPNCISTVEENRCKRVPLSFKGDLTASKGKLKSIILAFEDTKLVEESSNCLTFEFTTSIGNFIDDVVFYFDEETLKIHYKSSSREGYYDLGANKRRMKKIEKTWTEL